MDTRLILIILLGSVVTIGLAFYALKLWREVWQKKAEQLQQHQQQQTKRADDLRILLTSLNDEQAPWVELCIRISVILEHYDLELSQADDYAVFKQVYLACETIPTHQAWKDLPKLERRKFEAMFAELENTHRADSLKAAHKLLELLPKH